jgi:5-methyltetrahydropteroyltriglutamate--homocysteine methyltransferase
LILGIKTEDAHLAILIFLEETMSLPVYVMGQANQHAPNQPALKALYDLRRKGVRDGEKYERRLSSATAAFLEIFGLPGVCLIGLPGFRWDTPLEAAREIKGLQIAGEQTRFGETNTFVRILNVANPDCLSSDGIWLSDFETAKELTSIPLGVSIPGPYMMARYSRLPEECNNTKGFWQLVMKYSELLNEEVRNLQRAGVSLVRIDELELPGNPHGETRHHEALQLLISQTDFKRLALNLGAGAVSREMMDGYTNLPFSTFFLDFVKNPRIDILEVFPAHKKLVAGIMDGEEALMESHEELEAITLAVRKYVPDDRLALSLNTDPRYLPWLIALEKLMRLTHFASTFDASCPHSPNHCNRFFPRPTLTEKPVTPESLVKVGMDETAKARETHFRHFPFLVSSVGSFPQTEALRRARFLFRNNLFASEQYMEAALEETRRAVEHQEKLGFAVVASGECFRSDMAAWFGENMGGAVDHNNRLPSMDNLRYVPVVYPELIPLQPTGFLIHELKLIRPLTKLPIKVTVTGPATLAAWGLRQNPIYYHDSFRFRMDLAERLANELRLLMDGDTRIIQIDEPALTARREDFASDLVALEHCIAPFAHQAYLILHICYSDPERLQEFFPYILRLPVHQVHLEFANRSDAFLPLAQMIAESGKDIGLGVLDVHNDRIETVEEIMGRVERVLPYFGGNGRRIHLLPDCGQKAQSWEITSKKNQMMVLAARRLHEKYG